MDRGRKICAFLTENWPYLGNGKIRPRLLLITNRKWQTLFQMKRNLPTLNDLEGH